MKSHEQELNQESIDSGTRLHPFVNKQVTELKRQIDEINNPKYADGTPIAKYNGPNKTPETIAKEKSDAARLAELPVQAAAAQTFASDLMPMSDLDNRDTELTKIDTQGERYSGSFAIPLEFANHDELEQITETLYKAHIVNTLTRQLGGFTAKNIRPYQENNYDYSRGLDVVFTPPVIEKFPDKLLARFPSSYNQGGDTKQGLREWEKNADKSLVSQEQIKLSDEQVATLLNDFKAAVELQLAATDSRAQFDFSKIGPFFGELLKTRPNLSLDYSGLIVVTDGGKMTQDAANAAHMEYSMTKEHMATLAQTEMGASEPLSEGQVRNELAKERKKRGEAEADAEKATKATSTERQTKQAQIDQLSQDLSKKDLDLSSEKQRANQAERERDALQKKLEQAMAILKGAGMWNKGDKIEEALALLGK